MPDQFAFSQMLDKPKEETINRKAITFQDMPSTNILSPQNQQAIIDKFTKDEPVSIPMDGNLGQTHLSLILSPNLRDLELMIRGLEYVKRFNPLTGKDEVVLRKIPEHPLNEYGVNAIMQELKIYSSPEIKLGRKSKRDYYNSVQHVCHSVVRLVYKNLKNFGMTTQVKQRNAKVFCNAIIEIIDASFSRSIEGRENDASRPTAFEVQGNVDTVNDPSKFISPRAKESLKN